MRIFNFLYKRYQPKIKNGNVYIKDSRSAIGYIVTLFCIPLAALITFCCAVDDDGIYAAIFSFGFIALFFAFMRLIEVTYIFSDDCLLFQAGLIKVKHYYRDMNYAYLTYPNLIIEKEKGAAFVDLRYLSPEAEDLFKTGLIRNNIPLYDHVPNPKELRTRIESDTFECFDFYMKQKAFWVIFPLFAGWSFMIAYIFRTLDYSEYATLEGIALFLLINSGHLVSVAMICHFAIKYHITNENIEKKLFFITLKRIRTSDITKITSKNTSVRANHSTYFTNVLHIYIEEKEAFKYHALDDGNYSNFSKLLSYFKYKGISIETIN